MLLFPGHSSGEAPVCATSGKLARRFQLAAHALTICVIVFAASFAIAPFFIKGTSWMAFQEDDFYYYLKTAINFVHGAGSTFNGIVPTNGYHPLWFLLIAAACRISTSTLSIRIFLAATTFIATFATYALSRRLLARHLEHPLLINALAAYVVLYALHLLVCGMEVTLTIPLLLAAALAYQNHRLWQPLFWPAAGFGALLSALSLSRLDTILIVALFALATFTHPALRVRIGLRQAAGVVFGLTPVVLYFFSNRFFFHTWLPISGMAKQLKFTHMPSSQAWHSFLYRSPVQLRDLIPILIAIVLLPMFYSQLTNTQQAIYPVLLFFPFVYVFILSCLSDWPLWEWYYYSLRISLCISFGILLLWRPAAALLCRPWIAAASALFVLGLILHRGRVVGGNEILASAIDIRDFSSTHPGVYAMGDRAGMVGYLLPQPLVQTEGLVMDRDFLNSIQRQTPLQAALAPYHVRYYVATNHQPYTGCFHAVEPWQAGPASPRMTADLCQQPLATYTHGDLQTLIFQIER